jgi:hypothetical protein
VPEEDAVPDEPPDEEPPEDVEPDEDEDEDDDDDDVPEPEVVDEHAMTPLMAAAEKIIVREDIACE